MLGDRDSDLGGNMSPVSSGSRTSRRAMDDLYVAAYTELRKIAARYLRHQKPGHTLQPTALVNEAYRKLAEGRPVDWEGRAHCLAAAARAMRHILVNHAQAKAAVKRGGHLRRVTLRTEIAAPERPIDILELHRALDCLNDKDPRMAAVVELRVFGGLTVQQISQVLDVSSRTVDNLWKAAKLFLRDELTSQET